jgi:hypothetical protein
MNFTLGYLTQMLESSVILQNATNWRSVYSIFVPFQKEPPTVEEMQSYPLISLS